MIGLVFAQTFHGGGMNDSGHPWRWLVALVVLAAVVVLVVWLITRITTAHRSAPAGVAPPRSGAEDVLAERFARGEIDEDEFRRRRDALRS